jgi:hypothetical protein
MKIFYTLFLISILSSCNLSIQKYRDIKTTQNSFVDGSSDIPLLIGMNKVSEDELGFESSNGSISCAIYNFENDDEKIMDFYGKTLLQLGWKEISKESNKISFRRDKQNLTIEINTKKHNRAIKFFISSLL